MKTEVGSRVGAIVSIKNGVALSLGNGVYSGDEVPPSTPEMAHLRMFADNNIPNPKITLDSGGVVWGCECWWGPVDQMDKRLASCTVIITTPEEMRKGNKSSSSSSAGNYSSDDVQSL